VLLGDVIACATLSVPDMGGASTRGGAEKDAGAENAAGVHARNSPKPRLSLNVAGGEGRRSGMALWFASAFGDVRGVVGALRAGVSAASLSPLDPCAWWLASAPRPPASRSPRVSLPQTAESGADEAAHDGQATTPVHAGRRPRRGTLEETMRSMAQMRLVSSLHLALRWVRLDAGDLSLPSRRLPRRTVCKGVWPRRLLLYCAHAGTRMQNDAPNNMTRIRTPQHASWWQEELPHTWPL
jgi:hypothetical protein